MKRLYIRGDNGNTKAVIEILESIGAVNTHRLDGSNTSMLYTYDRNGDIVQYKEKDVDVNVDNVYSYLQFYTTFPYSINDEVKLKDSNKQFNITRMFWSEFEETICYEISTLSGSERTLARVNEIKPMKTKKIDKSGLTTTADAGKCILDTLQLLNHKSKIVFNNDAPNETELEFDSKLFELKVDDGKVFIVKKKPILPSTFRQCCNILGILMSDYVLPTCYNKEVFEEYMKLIICRDVYHKLAGNYKVKPGEYVYYIYYSIVGDSINTGEGEIHGNIPLVFPTEYMRDEFLKNFKNEINKVKHLL